MIAAAMAISTASRHMIQAVLTMIGCGGPNAAAGSLWLVVAHTTIDLSSGCVYRKFDSVSTQGTNGVSSRPDDRPAQADSCHSRITV
jgi:hypothetical protein